MTGFSNVIGGVKHWLERIYETATAKEIISVGADVGKKVIVSGALAGLSAHASGANKADTEKAIKDGALATLSTVGVTATTTEIENLVAHISDSIHADEQAPAPGAA